jgi:hypothetical protein
LRMSFRNRKANCFPGLIPVLLTIVGIVRDVANVSRSSTARRRLALSAVVARVLWLVAVIHALAAVVTVVFRRLALDLGLFNVRLADVTQCCCAVPSRTPPRCTCPHRYVRAPLPSCVPAECSSSCSSWRCGCRSDRPRRYSEGHSISRRRIGTYGPTFPGFEGLRVPARFAMIAALMLAALGAIGAAAIAQVRYGLAIARALGGVLPVGGRRRTVRSQRHVACKRVRDAGRTAGAPTAPAACLQRRRPTSP